MLNTKKESNILEKQNGFSKKIMKTKDINRIIWECIVEIGLTKVKKPTNP